MSLQSNNTFNTELKDLKTKLNQNYEAGYVATTTGSPQYRTGTPGTLTWIPPQLTEVADNSLLYISHTHYVDPKSLSIFSDADVDAFSSYLYNNKAANKNTFSLTVTNNQGVTYALVLSNETQFDSFYNTYISTTNAQNIFSSLFNNYVNSTKTSDQNENLFLQLLTQVKSGLSVLKQNTDGSWSTLGWNNSTNTKILTNCNLK